MCVLTPNHMTLCWWCLSGYTLMAPHTEEQRQGGLHIAHAGIEVVSGWEWTLTSGSEVYSAANGRTRSAVHMEGNWWELVGNWCWQLCTAVNLLFAMW